MAKANIVLNPAKDQCVVEITGDDGEAIQFDQIFSVPADDDELILMDEDENHYILADYGEGLALYMPLPMETILTEYDGKLSEYLEGNEDEDEDGGEPAGAAQ